MNHMQFRVNSEYDFQRAMVWCRGLVMRGLKGGPVIISLGREKRSNDQNSKLWPMLEDISRQVVWFNQKHSKEQWKDIITGSFRQCQFVPNIEGTGLVAIGLSTSKMRKPEFSELIEYIYAFGADQGVEWSDPALKAFEQYREAA